MSSAALLAMIASMESQLNEMKIALGSEPTKQKRAKKEKDPNAPPKEGNVWIKFTQRVSALLKAAEIDTGAAPVSKQFASALKDQKPYGDWTDEEIVAAWPSWTPPAESKMEAKRKLSASSGDESDKSSVKSAKEKKAPKPRTDEQKAATAAKRAATKAAKATAEPVAEAEEPAEAEAKASEPAEPVPKASEPVAKASEPVAKASEPAAKGAKAPKPSPKKSYKLEQLQDFGELEHEGVEYGVNARGDVVDTDGAYVGNWDGKKIVKGDKPADWAKVMPGSA